MGNCIQTDGPQYQAMKFPGSKDMAGSSHRGLVSRFQAIEGTLYLYRSILLRNGLHIQREIDLAVNKKEASTASFALKRQKLYGVFMGKIDEQRDYLREATYNAEQNKKKKECIKVLTATYALVQDIGDLINLEDALLSEDGYSKTQGGFETLFEKYGITTEEIKELTQKLDSRFEGIELTTSTCLQRGEIPHFLEAQNIEISVESSC